MTPTEAETLSTKMMVTWSRMAIPPSLWEEVFAELDYGTAGTTWAQLARENVHPPTIAEFVAKYRSLPTAHNQPIPHVCSQCGNDGFVSGYELVNEIAYPVLRACSCPNGANAQRQLDEAETHNSKQRARLFPHKDAP